MYIYIHTTQTNDIRMKPLTDSKGSFLYSYISVIYLNKQINLAFTHYYYYMKCFFFIINTFLDVQAFRRPNELFDHIKSKCLFSVIFVHSVKMKSLVSHFDSISCLPLTKFNQILLSTKSTNISLFIPCIYELPIVNF